LNANKRAWNASIVAVVVVIGTLGAASLFAVGYAAAGTPCSVTVHSENGADNAIQTAINAYPGGKICISAGTFPEQLTISNSHTVLMGAGASSTIIEPNSGSGPGSLSLAAVDWDSSGSGSVPCGSSTCVALAAIILVENSTSGPTTGVTVEDLQVNGSAGSNNVACGDDYVGVDFQNASGTLTDASVSDVASPPASFGCQEVSGAVYAYNGYFATGVAPSPAVAVTVSHTSVTGYQKNGVTCDDPAETCTLNSDMITGAGPTTLTAQNGVQIAYGALATVKDSTVTGNSFTGSTSSNDWYGPNGTYAATGILLYDPATGTTVTKNTVTLDQIGIAYVDDGSMDSGSESVTISHNYVNQSNAYGIAANGAPGGGDSVTIHANSIDNSATLNPSIWGAPGILVDTGTFTISNNHLTGSSRASGSSNGASQTVCAPSGYPTVCSTTQSIPTGAIQGASESGTNPTVMVISSNSYSGDSYRLTTLGVDGGTVNVDEVS
jgi:hypothetical protein